MVAASSIMIMNQPCIEEKTQRQAWPVPNPEPSSPAPEPHPDTSTNDDPSQALPNPFPSECLPSGLADMMSEVSRVLQVPASMTGPVVLAAVSASLGRSLQVASGPKRTTMGNVYILVSAENPHDNSDTTPFSKSNVVPQSLNP